MSQGNEKNQHHKYLTLVILCIGVLLIPVIYFGTYVASVWDVYGRTEYLPVAVVNEDKGSIYKDEYVNFGDQLVDNLKENNNLKWEFVDLETARNGLERDNKYYAVIDIPSDFTSELTSLSSDTKTQATITYSANEKRNYVASSILRTAVAKLKDKMDLKVAEKVTDTLVAQLKEVPDSLDEANEGVEKLKDGSERLGNGYNDIIDGNTTITNGLSTLSDGLSTALSGATQLSAGTTQLPTLISGSKALADGMETLKDGTSNLPKLVDGINKLDEGAQDAKAGADKLVTGSQAVTDGIQSVSDGLTTLDNTIQSGITSSKESMAQKVSAGVDSAVNTVYEGSDTTPGINGYVDGVDAYINGVTGDAGYVDSVDAYVNGVAGDAGYVDSVNSYTTATNQMIALLNAGGAENVAKAQAIAAQLSAINAGEKLQAAGTSVKTNGAKLQAADTSVKTNGAKLQAAGTSVKGSKELLASGLKSGLLTQLGSSLDSMATQISGGIQMIKTPIDGNESGTYIGADGEEHTALLPGATQVSNGVEQLDEGLATMTDGTQQLSDATPKLNALEAGVDKLADGSNTLANGALKLNDLANGINALADGMVSLSGGAVRLENGSVALGDGLVTARDGNSQVLDGLTTLNDGLSSSISGAREKLTTTDGLANAVGEGVDFKSEPFDEVANYGESFAPYFLNVSLWVGALTCMLTLYYDYKRTAKTLGPMSRKPLIRFFFFIGVALAQAMICGLVGQFGLGLEVNLPAAYYLGLCAISITYMLIVECLMVNLGDIGKMLSMVLMVLQLTATGGTFPVELNPAFFQAIHPYLPMTYSIQLMKEAISGHSQGYAWYNFGMQFIFAAIALGLLMLGNIIRRINNRKEGHKIGIKDAFHYGEEGHFSHIPHNH